MRKQVSHTEEKMMEGFRLGRQQCFTHVFNLFYHTLCFFASAIIRDEPAAQDIVEESFVKIWQRRGMFYQIPVLKSYLYATVKNGCLQWLLKNSDIRKRTVSTDQLVLIVDNDAFKGLIEAEVLQQVMTALEHLSPQQRQVIRLTFFQGKNSRQVAEELHIPQSTVTTQKSRAIHKLRKSIR